MGTSMNAFGYIDYKKPLGAENDMRTSNYRGHAYLTDTMVDRKSRLKKKPSVELPPQFVEEPVSDYVANYTLKAVNPYELKNPMIKHTDFIKPFDDGKLRFIQRKTIPQKSSSHQDFTWKTNYAEEKPAERVMPSEIKTTPIIIDRFKGGYVPHLDPSATTNRLTYIAYTSRDIMAGICAKDHITFWNWDKNFIPDTKIAACSEEMCDHKAAKHCTKRIAQFRKVVPHVPHSGMTTEVRDNYIPPHNLYKVYDITNIHTKPYYFPEIPFPSKTEYKVYGSGEPTITYV